MTMVYLFLGCIVIFVLFAIYCLVDTDYSMCGNKNYQVRFSPHNNKYYIVNVSHTTGREMKVTGRFGFTIYYDNQIDVDYVVEKLNK